VLKSSSMSGQWRPYPPPAICQFLRWARVALSMQHEEVGIATDDVADSAVDRQLQKLIVFRVAAASHWLSNLDGFGPVDQGSKEFETLLLSYILIELGTSQDFIELSDCRCRQQEASFVCCAVKRLSWDRLRKQNRAYDNSRVDDDAQFIHRGAARREFLGSIHELPLAHRSRP